MAAAAAEELSAIIVVKLSVADIEIEGGCVEIEGVCVEHEELLYSGAKEMSTYPDPSHCFLPW